MIPGSFFVSVTSFEIKVCTCTVLKTRAKGGQWVRM
jgi:hypothetical protein